MGRIAIPKGPRHSSYLLEYSDELVPTGKDFYESLDWLNGMIELTTARPGTRFATLPELVQIYKTSHQPPPRTPAFMDYFFHKTKNRRPYFEHTLTGLRWPDRWVGRLDGNAYRLIVLYGGEEVGETRIPPSFGNTVVEFDDCGIPIHIGGKPHNEPYAVHLYLETDAHFIPMNEMTGKHDMEVIVGRCEMGRHHDCIAIYADFGPSAEFPGNMAFRPVRVVLSKKEMENFKGQVSLAGPEGGELSLPDEDKAGRLTL